MDANRYWTPPSLSSCCSLERWTLDAGRWTLATGTHGTSAYGAVSPCRLPHCSVSQVSWRFPPVTLLQASPCRTGWSSISHGLGRRRWHDCRLTHSPSQLPPHHLPPTNRIWQIVIASPDIVVQNNISQCRILQSATY